MWGAKGGEPADSLTREFRIAPELRRCAWYTVFGFSLIFGCVAAMQAGKLLPRGPGWGQLAIIAALYLAPACGLVVLARRWRLRLDENGLARRWLWKWDVWTWEELERGAIERRGTNFFSASRSWPWNTLNLSHLTSADREWVLGACRHFFRPPTPEAIEIPRGEITLRYQLVNQLTIREGGIAGVGIARGGIDWSQVKQVRLLLHDHWSTEVRRIEFDLPGKTLRIEGVGKVTPFGRKPQSVKDPRVIPRVVELFLSEHAPPEKLARHALFGPPATQAEAETRRRVLTKKLRRVIWLRRNLPVVILLLSLLCMGRNLVGLWQGPPLFLNAWWAVLAAAIGIATLGAHPLIVWALLTQLHQEYSKILERIDRWEAEQGLARKE